MTHNSRGDIIGIYNGDGALRAQYEYDAWGNVLSVTDENGNAITSATHVGNLNPFRYRGYYYDTESGFYYLMSRYYDPVTHRFINADGYFQAGNGILDANTFAYCSNNPIMYSDPNGEFWGIIAAIAVVVVLVAVIVTAVAFPDNPVTGASASTKHQKTVEKTHTPSWSPINYTTGSTYSNTTTYGNSTKPISVYAQGRSDNWLNSSAGIKVNIKSFSLNISLGLDDIGISGNKTKDDITTSFGIKADLSHFKVGFEQSSTVKWDDYQSTTDFSNVSINGWFILALAFAGTSVPVPAPAV